MVRRILLFYKYVTIDNVQDVADWMKATCTGLDLKGRVILATEGINATLSGTVQATSLFVKIMESHPLFKKIDFKDSLEEASHEYFPRLRVVVKNEIVRMDVDPRSVTVKDTGKHLTPEQTHKLLENKPEDLVILDGRNYYEARVGRFEGAITPEIQYFRQFPEYIDKNLEQFKDKQVLMYCTGGIRCERASAYLKLKDVAKEVYQVKGGIHRYVEKFPNGFFRGKNYVFDDRIEVSVNNDVIASCDLCQAPYDSYTNCLNAQCNKHFICCPSCIEKYAETCSEDCKQLVVDGTVPVRPPLRIKKRNFCLIK
ncbi:rhodanese-related sulfurtransferase [Candidatus Dependentiae bacterium]|nr:rhodanese-related sulfurtransferase [Candidatus Dependentiae bacterium]